MSLTQKIFDACPVWLKFLFFELDENEKRLIGTLFENRMKIARYIHEKGRRIKTYEALAEKATECEQDSASMKLLLERYGNRRFHKYFSERIDDFDYDIKFLLGYRH